MAELHYLLAVATLLAACSAVEFDTYDFLMPGVTPYRDELYLCTPIRLSRKSTFFITEFKPNATMHVAHHMLLYGCTEPGSTQPVWNCGEMQGDQVDNKYKLSQPCRSGSQIIYAWARDAPVLKLPEGVGFLVGANSPIKYMVLQIHYMNKFPDQTVDKSGVILKFTKEKLTRQAGVFLLGTSGVIRPHGEEHMEAACTLSEDKVIHPFAFRTHTHSLGKVVSGYVVRQSASGDSWQLLGKRDPQTPQMFYPVDNPAPVQRGDVLAARCTMVNNNSQIVRIGSTNKDEMCNFYLMYYVENDTPLEQKYCFTPGPPRYYWTKAREGFNTIPDLEASTL